MTVSTPNVRSLPPRRDEESDLCCEDFQIRKLWQAVIGQAKADLQNKKVGRIQRKEATNWIQGEPCFPSDATDYFAEVCEMAGVEAAPEREKILQNVEFTSAKRSDIDGSIVEPKYCEVCGKSFLRSQGSKRVTCDSCGAREAGRFTRTLASAVSVGIAYLESDPDARTGQPKKPYVPGDLLRMTCLAANVPLNQAQAQLRWPWLREDVEAPCDCENLIVSNALLVLQHLYERHVQAQQDWTAEELIAWVQKHEHADLAPEQAEPPEKDAQVSNRSAFAGVGCVGQDRKHELVMQGSI